MISVGIKEFKAKLSGYIDHVRHGEEIVITDRKTEVALVIPLSKERRLIRALMVSGKAHWRGGKPSGIKGGIVMKGPSLAETVLEERR